MASKRHKKAHTCSESMLRKPQHARSSDRTEDGKGVDAPATTCSSETPSQQDPAENLTQVTVDPVRFINAAQAAFAVGKDYRNPHGAVLLALMERFDAPTSLGLPDPFAPAMKVLVNMLYGPSKAYWGEATAVFRRRYLNMLCCAGKVGLREAAHEADAAVLRWRTLMILAGKAPDAMREWLEDIPADLYPKSSLIQARHRATAMVYQAAMTTLWQDDSQNPAHDDHYGFNLDALVFTTSVMGRCNAEDGVDDQAIEAIWNGLFDVRLIASRQAFSSLTQRFLAYLVNMVGSSGVSLVEVYRVWSDELADWAQVDPQWVRDTCASSDANHSPAHEISNSRLRLPDCLWSDYNLPHYVELSWFSAPPRGDQHDGRWWQEVTITRELIPYLHRLYLCQNQCVTGPK